MLGGFSKHMWLFDEGMGWGFCNYTVPLHRLRPEPVTTQAAANRPGC